MYSKRFAHLDQWTRAVRDRQVRLHLPITVIAVQCIKLQECLEPLKNTLGALCRAIQSIGEDNGRIFIVNNVPNPRQAPVLGQRTADHNKLLFRAVIGVNKMLRRVFYCDMAQHFVTPGTTEWIQPVSQYFDQDGNLTETGCFMYRSCLFRKIGILPYSL